MNIDEWFHDKRNIEKSFKPYLHFDIPTDIQKSKKHIEDPKWVSEHGFYPFIQFEKKLDRYSKDKDEVIHKTRLISYASHLDSCIFQYYGFLLNEKYNDYAERKQISESVVAYRTNFKGKSNISFAHDAFSFIKDCGDCYVFIGDFTDFFGSLNHSYLKQRLCDVLGLEYLPDDWYAVFKNITRFSWIDFEDILDFYKVSNKKDLDKLDLKKYDSPKEFRKQNFKIKSNKVVGKGIPQGSSMSGVLANVYMTEIDVKILKTVTKNSGKYIRYSDDFIIIIPKGKVDENYELFRSIASIFNDKNVNLELKDEKKQFFLVENQKVEDLTNQFAAVKAKKKGQISFLGFSFDGKSISLRSKTENRFYRKLRKKAKNLSNQRHQEKRRSEKEIYELYSIRGDYSKKGDHHKGNFLTYARRAENIFQDEPNIQRIRNRNLAKVRKFINKEY